MKTPFSIYHQLLVNPSKKGVLRVPTREKESDVLQKVEKEVGLERKKLCAGHPRILPSVTKSGSCQGRMMVGPLTQRGVSSNACPINRSREVGYRVDDLSLEMSVRTHQNVLQGPPFSISNRSYSTRKVGGRASRQARVHCPSRVKRE